MNSTLKLFRIFAYVSILTLGPAWGDISKDAATPFAAAKTEIAKDAPKRADRLYAEAQIPAPAKAAAAPACDKASSSHSGRSHAMGRHHADHRSFGSKRLARKLAAMETEIGIRSNQLDAWRDFTNALLAMAAAPMMPEPSQSVGGPEDESEEGADAQDKPETGEPQAQGSDDKAEDKAEPFARAQRVAEAAVERGKAAEKLLSAIDGLKSALTPEQLAKVETLEGRGHHGPHRYHHKFKSYSGSRDHGPKAYGPRDYGPRDYGPKAYGPSRDFGPRDFNRSAQRERQHGSRHCARADAGEPRHGSHFRRDQ